MERRHLYFNEALHKYTDELGLVYTSTTTLISNYYEKFNGIEVARACAKIGRNPRHPKYLKYKGKSEKEILYEWEATGDFGRDRGNRKHNYLENAIRSSTGYKLIEGNFINDKIYTLDDVIGDRKIGLINIEFLESIGLKEKYPIIFNIIYKLTQSGFLIYAEIGVYDSDNLVSGLVDLLLIRGLEFIIVDWKTNSDPIMFNAGYFEKTNEGKRTLNFITKEEYFHEPISHLPTSVGHKYSLQVSGYANLIEGFGFKYKGSILCHIRTIEEGVINKIQDIEKEEIKLVNVLDLRQEFQRIKEHHYNKNHMQQVKLTLF